MIQRKLKNELKRLMRFGFELGQRFGFDVLPRHFYSQIPNVRELRVATGWREPYTMCGIMGDISAQVNFVDHCTKPFRLQLAGQNLLAKALEMNGSDEGFGPVEADFLYCFVRKHQPANIVQVGCGVSTAVCLLAARDASYRPVITCVEPYPTAFLKASATSGDILLKQCKLQEVYKETPNWLSAGDLFFVDSSHTLGPSGEVGRIVLEVLPRLASGVFVHFHDIWFPFDYSPSILTGDLFFWHETALLMAFLSMNQRFRVEASLSMLHHSACDQLRQCLPNYLPAPFAGGVACGAGHYPSSIYLSS